jgi:ElaB/YqjD/DUF883 family membrane-anchored ribosome-binding protein
MPEIIKPKRSNGYHNDPEDPALVRADLVRARHHFEEAADAVRQDIDALRTMVTWRALVRSRPFLGLAFGVAAGLVVGLWLGSLRRD